MRSVALSLPHCPPLFMVRVLPALGAPLRPFKQCMPAHLLTNSPALPPPASLTARSSLRPCGLALGPLPRCLPL
jgi:hypothetical protein